MSSRDDKGRPRAQDETRQKKGSLQRSLLHTNVYGNVCHDFALSVGSSLTENDATQTRVVSKLQTGKIGIIVTCRKNPEKN